MDIKTDEGKFMIVFIVLVSIEHFIVQMKKKTEKKKQQRI